ncbi:M3 family oligoendopeptidase [Caldanaerobacter subterraneus]|uniref:M3 family oligoendopeptidase n=1 Tax=Caldanaerobacter subterraneus TaxID=911092 RepID=A0A7Y2L6W3_9THEO|nr:M3 family oligoendopeptidase [Caldanaerobacter subterraneus]NNG66883.1 M3 family oligoendopeptidase [Caldanaerobacter subterraneus]
MRWSLDVLYTSFDSEEFQKDNEKIISSIEHIRSWTEENLRTYENSKEKLEYYIKFKNELGDLMVKVRGYSALSLSVDVKNEKALKALESLENISTMLAEPETKFKRWLLNMPNLEETIQSSSYLKEHEFFIKETVKEAMHLLSEKEETIIAKMKNTGSEAWAKLYDLLTSTLLVDININGEEKKLPLSVVRNMAYDKDAYIRKTAYFAELNSYKKIEDASAACLNGIKGEVITVTELRKYSSPLEMTLQRSRMDFETLEAMLEAIEEYLPEFRRYLKEKARLLGHKDGLPFYDLFAPVGKLDKKFTFDEAKEFIVGNFNSFSEDLAQFAKKAFENSWIDAEPREGKRGGAFCYNLHPIKQSRILANFDGSFSNVLTLAHELGHGYHGHLLANETLINSRYPMPIAETASIFNEHIIVNSALKTASKEEKLSIIENSLQRSTQTIVDIYSRFLFEDEVIKRRKDHSLSVEELKQIMIEAQKKTYGDGLDQNYLHPYMWINKPHYYDADLNYYNFPYAFGELFVKGLIYKYNQEGKKFVEEYKNLLSQTGKKNLYDLGKIVGFDLHSKDFWRKSLDVIKEEIDQFISLI